MAPPRKKAKLNFEQSLKRLEKIVQTLEDDQIALEDSLKLFEEGKALARACETELTEAENRVRLLMENDEGESEETDFEAEEEEADPREAQVKKESELPF